jgi:hypothetical protein
MTYTFFCALFFINEIESENKPINGLAHMKTLVTIKMDFICSISLI